MAGKLLSKRKVEHLGLAISLMCMAHCIVGSPTQTASKAQNYARLRQSDTVRQESALWVLCCSFQPEIADDSHSETKRIKFNLSYFLKPNFASPICATTLD